MGTYRIPPVSNLLMWSQQKITVTFLRYCVQNILEWTGTSNQIQWKIHSLNSYIMQGKINKEKVYSGGEGGSYSHAFRIGGCRARS